VRNTGYHTLSFISFSFLVSAIFVDLMKDTDLWHYASNSPERIQPFSLLC